MAGRSTSAKALTPNRAVLPKGGRIPQTHLLIWLIRGPILACLVLFIAHPIVIGWAEAQLGTTNTPQSTIPSGWIARLFEAPETNADTGADPVALILAQAIMTVLSPDMLLRYGKIGTLGAVVLCAEVVLTLYGQHAQRRNAPRVPTTYLLIRGQIPQVSQLSGRMAGASYPSGDQFYRAIQQSIPAEAGVFGLSRWMARLQGTAPWVAFTLTGLPDQPILMGVVVADANPLRRADTVMQIRAIIQGQSLGAQVDEVSDPLLDGLTPGVRVVWHEYGLALAPHYPLRFLDDIEGSDLLGPLVHVLRPSGTVRTEFQLVLRPANAWTLNWGWRGRATALKLALDAKHDYALSDDTQTIEAKLDAAPFEATLRVCVVAKGEAADASITAALSQIGGMLGQYHQRTSHHLQRLMKLGQGQAVITTEQEPLAIFTRAPRFAPLPALLLPWQCWRLPDLLTSIELAGFWHPPTSGLGSAVRWLNSKYLPAPAEAFIGSDPERIIVGNAHHADGTVAPVGPTWRDLRQVLHITAGMGAGKTRLLANICAQALPYGMLLLDGKGDDAGCLATRVRSYVSLEDERRLILFNILDTEWPIGLNPLAGIDFTRPGAQTQALGQIMAIFSRLDPGWAAAPGMQEYVLNASLLVFEGQIYPTLAHIKQALLDESYRKRLLVHCTNPEIRTYWLIEYPQHGEKQKQSLFALMRRFARLLTDNTTRYLVSQAVPRLSLLEAIEEGKIVLAPMPHQTLGTIASAVGMLLLQAILRAAMMRAGDDTSRTTFPLLIDELQVFIGEEDGNKDMEMATSQLRGFGIAGIYAHQTISQLGPLENEMLTNAGSRIVLRTQEPDASSYARMYADRGVTAADISGQDPEEHQYADLLVHRRKTKIFSMHTLGWPEPKDVIVPPYDGPFWQTVLPSDGANVAFDRDVCKLVYTRHTHPDLVAARLAERSEDEWHHLLDRWAAIREYQRAYILDHPGCVSDRMERQTWLTRLGYATPAILAEAEYARIRRAIAPNTNPDPLDERNGIGQERSNGRGERQSARGGHAPVQPPIQRAHLLHVDPERAGNVSDGAIPDDLYRRGDGE